MSRPSTLTLPWSAERSFDRITASTAMRRNWPRRDEADDGGDRHVAVECALPGSVQQRRVELACTLAKERDRWRRRIRDGLSGLTARKLISSPRAAAFRPRRADPLPPPIEYGSASASWRMASLAHGTGVFETRIEEIAAQKATSSLLPHAEFAEPVDIEGLKEAALFLIELAPRMTGRRGKQVL